VADVLEQPDSETVARRVRQEVEAMGRAFPVGNLAAAGH